MPDAVIEKFARALALRAHGVPRSAGALGGFVDSLLQKFENCRPGLGDDRSGPAGESAETFFARLYAEEVPRLKDQIRIEEPQLGADERAAVFAKVDGMVRGVVLPAYVRLSSRYTARERNGFYLAPEPFHGLERFGWALAGAALGGLVVWAPFIPLWSKEWVLPFLLGGLFFPELRRVLAVRTYERELNRLVASVDDEVSRLNVRLLFESRAPAEERPAVTEEGRAPRRTAVPEG
jgi:hypothetical protein